MLGNDSDAADAAQETLLLAVRSIARFDGRSSFSTWMYRIATNACIDELRRRRRRPFVATGLDGYGPGRDGPGRDGPGRGSYEAREALWAGRAFGSREVDPAEAATQRVDVDAALSLLALDFRTAVVLRDLCDLTYEEIAQVLDVPVGTVRSRIARGRATLADLLQGAGNSVSSGAVEAETGTDEGDRTGNHVTIQPHDRDTPLTEQRHP